MPAEGWRKCGSVAAEELQGARCRGSEAPQRLPRSAPAAQPAPLPSDGETEAWGAAAGGARGRQQRRLECGEREKAEDLAHRGRARRLPVRAALLCCPLHRRKGGPAGGDPELLGRPWGSACMSYRGNPALQVGFSSGVGIRQFKFGLKEPRTCKVGETAGYKTARAAAR